MHPITTTTTMNGANDASAVTAARSSRGATVVRGAVALGVAGALVAGTVGFASADAAAHASATIVDTDGRAIGFAELVESATGAVHVNIKVAGLPAGRHGVHLHENGSCSSETGPFDGAGGHYNPSGTTHSDHVGDLPNLEVNVAGRGHLEATTTRVTLTAGATSLFDATAGHAGTAVIIHANEDDFGPIANGNSGGRIACGVIVTG